MYKQSNENDYKDVLEKIQQKTLAYGDKTLMAEFRLEPRSGGHHIELALGVGAF